VVLEELGRGGMGIVYKARHTALQRLVALKMIRSGSGATPSEVARFRAEATAVAQLQHPHIVQIYEVGEHAGLPFFSLELVDGPTLADRLAGTPQPARPAAEMVEAVARALAAAHQRGIVHRDLKPGNILLARPLPEAASARQASEAEDLYGIPKVTDFGLAKRLDVGAGQTRSGDFVGTPGYMAPEQATGQNQRVGPPADVFALGALLYEMLTGRPPFLADNLLEIVQLLTHEEPVPPRWLQPSVPCDLETICLKCLHKNPGQRYASAATLADDLRRFLDGVPVQGRRPGPGERLRQWCRRYPLAATLLAGVTFCLVFGFWYFSRLTDHLVRSAALESAAQQADFLEEVNDSYTEVVKRAKAGRLTVTHDYETKPAAIPIPATFTIELGQQISDRSQTGVQIRLYSYYPFRGRRHGGPRDAFERTAIDRLRADPTEPVYQFEEYKGRPVLRYATARRMQPTCVQCHNTHPDSPKKDWQVGDVRGVVEIIRPLDRDAARTRAGIWQASLLLGAVVLGLLGLAGVLVRVGRLRRAALPGRTSASTPNG
jgi:hypothetical protein